MPDGGNDCTAHILRDLVETVTAPASAVPARFSDLIAPFAPHGALVILTADVDGGHRRGAGDPAFVTGVSFLDLDERLRAQHPGSVRRERLDVAGEPVETLLVLSRNGALLALAAPIADAEGEQVVLDLWNIVSLRIQELADAAAPGYLRQARTSAGQRMEALAEVGEAYSTTLATVLAVLRSTALADGVARTKATALATEGLVDLRTSSDRARTTTEEPVTTAFARLRDDLRPVVDYRDIDVQLVEPPADGRPLPSEVAHGARAVVRGSILALAEDADVRRVRVQWDCDGTNLLIDIRDDGDGTVTAGGGPLALITDRVKALRGRIDIDATPGWGTDMSIVIPLDPPHAHGISPAAWSLGPRETDVLDLLAAGRRNRDIAGELGISENTVKFHVANVYRKLGVSSRAEATATYLERVHHSEADA
ncbi:LuxR C-terminal-related transcriptional regulator [Microbacterium sp. G2-8]|uniref:helix-turn-helix transcriptional regulator n=1 Tax=Microbacterium sp. G2-8 TaxID=2842454 RepID=UPI001C8A841D|nr:LuxR C-terminal-related transcriptional regulator [Microbacterium sp. G2-8]